MKKSRRNHTDSDRGWPFLETGVILWVIVLLFRYPTEQFVPRASCRWPINQQGLEITCNIMLAVFKTLSQVKQSRFRVVTLICRSGLKTSPK